MDKVKLEEALALIEEALKDKDFNDWVTKNLEQLNHDYDEYVHYHEITDGEPLPFDYWALKRYVYDE